MFGAVCKGLHCAGCGKGIPAGAVLSILGIVILSNGQLRIDLIEIAATLFVGALAMVSVAFFVIHKLTQVMPVVTVRHANDPHFPGYSSLTNMPQNAIPANVNRNPVPEWMHNRIVRGEVIK